MTGWMFALQAVAESKLHHAIIGVPLIIASIYAIRTQLFIDRKQYLLGMIPHHSMAVHMSRKLIQKEGENVLYRVPQKIIETQQKEIQFFKSPPPI